MVTMGRFDLRDLQMRCPEVCDELVDRLRWASVDTMATDVSNVNPSRPGSYFPSP